MGKKKINLSKSKTKQKKQNIDQSNEQKQQSFIEHSQILLEPPKYKNIVLDFIKFKELIEQHDISQSINHKDQLSTKKLLHSLAEKCGFQIKSLEVKYLLQDTNIWMMCPRGDVLIDKADYQPYDCINFTLGPGQSLIDTIMRDSAQQSCFSVEDVPDNKCRRLKERKIKHVIEKVLKWRQLYAGGQDGTAERISLDEGAKIVNISKKTLDDYLAQIKKGKKYGFNFNDHKNDKIGVLRDFIRKQQRRNKN